MNDDYFNFDNSDLHMSKVQIRQYLEDYVDDWR
jgi:hypothetical protein